MQEASFSVDELIKEVDTIVAETNKQASLRAEEDSLKAELAEYLVSGRCQPLELGYSFYIIHYASECLTSTVVSGCPMPKCRLLGNGVTLYEVEHHLENDCAKIQLQCSKCKDELRRPDV